MSSALILPCDTEHVSDGYHTFMELYDHRTMLWILVLKHYKDQAFKTRLDDNGSSMDGWFIAGLNTEFGQLTYHIPEIYWDYLDVQQLDRNASYDGHNSEDVLNRLAALVEQ